MHRLKVTRDGQRTECPAAHRTILVQSCSQGADEHCDCFQGLEMSGVEAYVLCDYGFEDRQTSIIVPGGSGVKK